MEIMAKIVTFGIIVSLFGAAAVWALQQLGAPVQMTWRTVVAAGILLQLGNWMFYQPREKASIRTVYGLRS